MRSFIPPSHSTEQDIFTDNNIPLDYRIYPSSVARNTILIFGTQILTRILGFLSSIFLANYLGTQNFGIFNYAFALTALFIPLCDLGMDTYLLREISKGVKETISGNIESVLTGKMFLTLMDFIILVIVATIMESFGSSYFLVILLAGAVTFFRTYWTSFSSVFRALNRVNYDVTIFSLIRIAEFGMILTTIILHRDTFFLLFGLGIINIIAVCATFIVVQNRFIKIKLQTNFGNIRRSLRGGLPFALTAIFVTIYFNIDTVLVKLIVTESAAGIYRAAYNLVIPMLMVTASTTAAVFPYVSQNYHKRIEHVQRIVQESSAYLLMIAMPMAIIGTILSTDIIHWLFKPGYSEASTSLMILVWFLPIAYLTNLFGNVLGAMDDQAFVLKVAAVNVSFNILANLILIPIYAQNGAAVTTVLTELIGLSFLYFRMKKKIGTVIAHNRLIRTLLACGIIIPFLFFRIQFPLLITIGIAATIYTIGLILFRAISVKDVQQLIFLIRGNNENK